jgi:hypothetical protein
MFVPERTVSKNGRVTSAQGAAAQIREEKALRKLAVEHLENVRRFKRYLWVYVLSMAVLTPIWVITQYEQADGWLKHLSSRSRYAGDWDPWLIWVALIGAFVVGLAAYRAYFDRPETEADVKREMERLKTRI